MNFDEAVLFFGVLQDDDAAAVGAGNNIVLLGSWESERLQGTDDAEDFCGMNDLHSALLVRTEELEHSAAGNNNLLQLWRREIPVDCSLF